MKNFLTTVCLASIFLLISGFTNTTQIDKISTINVIENDNVIANDNVISTEFNQGFKDGYCAGWKDVKGKNAYCPYAPYPPYPTYSQSADSYRDGYNTGFKAGMRAAEND